VHTTATPNQTLYIVQTATCSCRQASQHTTLLVLWPTYIENGGHISSSHTIQPTSAAVYKQHTETSPHA
jgi:hypothetical protein